MFGVGILLGLGLLVIPTVLVLPFVITFIARFDLFYTFIKEGRGVVVKHGDGFYKVMIRWAGHDIIDSKEKLSAYVAKTKKKAKMWKIIPSGIVDPTKLSWLERSTGARWIGIPPFYSLYKYKFNRTMLVDVRVEGGSLITKPSYSDEETKWIFLSATTYWGEIPAAETNENVPINVGFLETVVIDNPWDALFGVNQWLETIMKLSIQRGRQYVGTRSYNDLIQKEDNVQKEGFSGGLMKLRAEVLKKFGVEVIHAEIYSIELSGKAADAHEEAATAKFTADAKAAATVITATANSRAIELEGEARAKSVAKQLEQFATNPDAAAKILDAEVGRNMGLGNVVRTVAKAVKEGMTT